jgi:hypothetical protein
MHATRVRLLGMLMALTLAVGGVGAAGLAQAEPPEGHGEGAVVERGECFTSVDAFAGPCTFTAVLTPSGNAVFKAQGTLAEGIEAPEKAVHISGFPCITPAGPATSSRLTVTPSGRYHLTCKVKHPKPEKPEKEV